MFVRKIRAMVPKSDIAWALFKCSSDFGSGMAPAPTARRPYPKRTSRRWSPRLARDALGARTAFTRSEMRK